MDASAEVSEYLVVNRVEVLSQGCCAVCGRGFTNNPIGEKAMVLTLGNGQRTYFFCGGCGDNIVSRVESDDTRRRYVWDWAIPLRNGRPG